MQNLVTCQYETKIAGLCRRITVAWLKTATGQAFSVTIDDPSCQGTCKVKLKPWSFWKRCGMKSFDVCGCNVEVFWELSRAKFGYGPEPQQAYFVAVVCNGEVVLLLGDRDKEAYRHTKAKPSTIEAILLSRKEHVFGKKHFCTKAQFGDRGRAHDILIECQTAAPRDPYLCITVDKQLVVQVKNLEWKFRGNQTVVVDGIPVEVLWDVHNWMFDSAGRPSNGNAIFMFQASAAEEALTDTKVNGIKWSGDLNGNVSLMKLAGTKSLKLAGDTVGLRGSSLTLHAWRNA